MFLRLDRLLADIPQPRAADPNAAAALQELLGGKYGEMSTLNNYMFQSFNFRNKSKLRPFYSVVASITAEEVGHVEMVSNGVAMLANGPDADDDADDDLDVDISDAAFEDMKTYGSPRRLSRAAAAPCRPIAMVALGMAATSPRRAT